MSNTKDILQDISDWIHVLLQNPRHGNWIIQFSAKFIFLVLLTYAIGIIIRFVINFIFKYYHKDEQRYPIIAAIRRSKIINSLANLIALGFGYYALYSIFYRHPESYKILERVVGFVVVIVSAGLAFRLLKALEEYHTIKLDYYQLAALRAISQTVKIFGIFIFTVVAVSIIFNINSNTILGSLGAITAVLVLVFRDTILGFVTGIHVATSRNLKQGDWIGIPKYNLEGTIEDINLLTTKIRNFDKTISTIPTYDLLTTEIKNLQVMSESNTRRIKKSIIFNISSFKFVDDELYARLKRINLIHDYIDSKWKQIEEERKNVKNSDEITNAQTMTNIGVFRIYSKAYLKRSKELDQNATLVVRQLEITPQGLPLEIYCFANKSQLEEFEQIQSDIFDHLLVAAKEFDLEVMQTKV